MRVAARDMSLDHLFALSKRIKACIEVEQLPEGRVRLPGAIGEHSSIFSITPSTTALSQHNKYVLGEFKKGILECGYELFMADLKSCNLPKETDDEEQKPSLMSFDPAALNWEMMIPLHGVWFGDKICIQGSPKRKLDDHVVCVIQQPNKEIVYLISGIVGNSCTYIAPMPYASIDAEDGVPMCPPAIKLPPKLPTSVTKIQPVVKVSSKAPKKREAPSKPSPQPPPQKIVVPLVKEKPNPPKKAVFLNRK